MDDLANFTPLPGEYFFKMAMHSSDIRAVIASIHSLKELTQIFYPAKFMMLKFLFSDEWSMEDKVIFEQSFNSHGKHFSKIRANVSGR